MSHRSSQREGFQIQEYVHLQETFNTIIRSLERIERSDNINRSNPVKRNNQGDIIHLEYESMREALITQCLCLQVGMTDRRFQNNQVENDLVEQINKWKRGIKERNSEKVSQALIIVDRAIAGRLDPNEFTSGGLPSNHSQAVGNIFKARSNLDEISNNAKKNPSQYYQSNQYAIKIGEKFGGSPCKNVMEFIEKNTDSCDLKANINKLESEKNNIMLNLNKTNCSQAQKHRLNADLKKCEEKITQLQRELKTLYN